MSVKGLWVRLSAEACLRDRGRSNRHRPFWENAENRGKREGTSQFSEDLQTLLSSQLYLAALQESTIKIKDLKMSILAFLLKSFGFLIRIQLQNLLIAHFIYLFLSWFNLLCFSPFFFCIFYSHCFYWQWYFSVLSTVITLSCLSQILFEWC